MTTVSSKSGASATPFAFMSLKELASWREENKRDYNIQEEWSNSQPHIYFSILYVFWADMRSVAHEHLSTEYANAEWYWWCPKRGRVSSLALGFLLRIPCMWDGVGFRLCLYLNCM